MRDHGRGTELLDHLLEAFAAVTPADLDPVLRRALAEVGRAAGASRAYVTRFDQVSRQCRVTHQWNGPGVPAHPVRPEPIRGDRADRTRLHTLRWIDDV